MKYATLVYWQSKKTIATIGLKAAIFILLIGILYTQIFVRNDVESLYVQFQISLKQGYGIGLISLALLLVPMNWFLESLKWKMLISKFQEFSFRKAVFSVLSGVSVAIITPGRIGEYGGRLVGIEKNHHSKAILANLISSLAQNIMNLGIGLFLALGFIQNYFPLQKEIFLSLLFIGIFIVSILILIYYRIDLLGGLLAYLPETKWIITLRKTVIVFDKLPRDFLNGILALSFFRYIVYLAQYVLLIQFFGVSDEFWPSVMAVATIFFLQSNLPLPPALSVLARGEMAIFLWSVFTTNVLGIISATFTLWIINLVLPAIAGSLILMKSKIFEE